MAGPNSIRTTRSVSRSWSTSNRGARPRRRRAGPTTDRVERSRRQVEPRSAASSSERSCPTTLAPSSIATLLRLRPAPSSAPSSCGRTRSRGTHRSWPSSTGGRRGSTRAMRATYVDAGLHHAASSSLSLVGTLAYVFWVRSGPSAPRGSAAAYPASARRDDASFSCSAKSTTRPSPSPRPRPRWLIIPERGLFTGIAIVGAIGTGKTSGCMYPVRRAAPRLPRAGSARTHRRPRPRGEGRLLLPSSARCCARHGRADDYVEISLDAPYRYNPLHNDLDAYALAYGIASLLNNLFGRSKEPFWQQAYTNLVKFVILLHKVVDDYVTLFDVYESAINPDRIAEQARRGGAALSRERRGASQSSRGGHRTRAGAPPARLGARHRRPGGCSPSCSPRAASELLDDHDDRVRRSRPSRRTARRSTADGSSSSPP